MFVRVHFLYLCFIYKSAGDYSSIGQANREPAFSLPRGWSTTWLHPNLFLLRTIPSLLSYFSLSQSYYEIALPSPPPPPPPPSPPPRYLAISSSVSSPEIDHDRLSLLPALPLHFLHPIFSPSPPVRNDFRFTSFTLYRHWLWNNWRKTCQITRSIREARQRD